jgi:hypothetical protein
LHGIVEQCGIAVKGKAPAAPFIPGIRSIPRWVPVHRLIWRDYYREHPRSR